MYNSLFVRGVTCLSMNVLFFWRRRRRHIPPKKHIVDIIISNATTTEFTGYWLLATGYRLLVSFFLSFFLFFLPPLLRGRIGGGEGSGFTPTCLRVYVLGFFLFSFYLMLSFFSAGFEDDARQRQKEGGPGGDVGREKTEGGREGG